MKRQLQVTSAGSRHRAGTRRRPGCAALSRRTNAHAQAPVARRECLPELGPSPGFTNLRWIKPVYPGDVIAYCDAVTGKREIASRPRWGLVTKHSEGVNQNGELVFAFDGKVMVERKPAKISGISTDRAQAAKRAVFERDVAAMGARDVAGDGEAEAGAGLILIARLIEPDERPEHVFAQC